MGSSLSGIFWEAPDYDASDNEQAAESSEDEKSIGSEGELPPVPEPMCAERRYARALPRNVEDAAIEHVTHMARAQLTLAGTGDDQLLVVQLPKGARKAAAPQPLCWPLQSDQRALAAEVRALMAEDGLKRISMQEMCARYPGYFWNLVFHHAKNTESITQFISDEFTAPPHK